MPPKPLTAAEQADLAKAQTNLVKAQDDLANKMDSTIYAFLYF